MSLGHDTKKELKRKKSYMVLKIPNRKLYEESRKESIEYHKQFTEWFTKKYILKINGLISENINSDVYITNLKVRLSKDIISQYKITSKSNVKHRYYLPKVVYESIISIWKKQGWIIEIRDNILYGKDKVITDISEGIDKFSRSHVIMRVIFHKNLIPDDTTTTSEAD